MKLYLAARYARKHEIRAIAEQMKAFGHEIVSSWLDEPHPPTITLAELDDDVLYMTARKDLTEIDAADWLILFSEDPEAAFVRGGRHVEFGYAYARGINMYVVGPRENIFTWLVPTVASVEELPFMKEAVCPS